MGATPVFYEPLPPDKAIKYLAGKGTKLSWNWYDTWQGEHAKAFTVAHCMKADILQDIRNAVQAAIDNGESFNEFKEKLQPLLQSKGWWGKQVGINPKTGEEETYYAGTPWRLKTIFDTNVNTAYSAGNYKGKLDNADVAPYWQYDAIMDDRTRDSHAALDGKIWRWDDPIWDSIYPPNDWGCRCSVIALSAAQVQEKGLQVEPPTGGQVPPQYQVAPDEWNYNPAKAGAYSPQLDKYDQELKAQLEADLAKVAQAKKDAEQAALQAMNAWTAVKTGKLTGVSLDDLDGWEAYGYIPPEATVKDVNAYLAQKASAPLPKVGKPDLSALDEIQIADKPEMDLEDLVKKVHIWNAKAKMYGHEKITGEDYKKLVDLAYLSKDSGVDEITNVLGTYNTGTIKAALENYGTIQAETTAAKTVAQAAQDAPGATIKPKATRSSR